MERVKIVIVGAGIIGLAAAEAISSRTKDALIVIEKHSAFGRETSSRNSEVIHAGIYYPKDSLKSSLCLKGNRMLYEYCAQNGIKHLRCGKIIVSTTEKESLQIKEIYDHACRIGVPGLCLLQQKEINEIEPQVYALNGIYSESTGILDSHGLMSSLFLSAQKNGALFAFGREVDRIEKTNDGYLVATGQESILAEYVINCCGLYSDRTAAMAGFDIKALGYKLHYCKGDYFSVSGSKGKLKHLVYPIPREKGYGLGIHATLDLEGSLRLGPDAEYVDQLDYNIDAAKRKEFCASANRFLPWLNESDLAPDTSGIRPKLQGPEEDFRDFVIREGSDSGYPGFINLIGIESPGLTASLAIGEYVAGLIR